MSGDKLQITLYRGFPGSGIYTWSPFVTKLEARLRFAGISYRTESGSPRSAPRGKIPYLELAEADGTGQRTLSDSAFIIKDFIENGYLDDVNATLTPAEKTYAIAIASKIEDRIADSEVQSHEKWIDNYYTMRDHVLGAIPYPLRVIIGLMAYRKNVQALHAQGTGRLSPEEIAASRFEIWESLSQLLLSAKSSTPESEDVFWVLGGKSPTEADTVLFGFIVSAVICTACPENTRIVNELPILVEYATRIHARYFPGYKRWDEA